MGLLFAGAITYRQTRAELLGRINHQLRTASGSPGLFFPEVNPGESQVTNTLLPPGMWAELRSAFTGRSIVVNRGVLDATGGPVLPPMIKPGSLFTVDSP